MMDRREPELDHTPYDSSVHAIAIHDLGSGGRKVWDNVLKRCGPLANAWEDGRAHDQEELLRKH